MNRLSTLLRRAVAVLVGALLGLAGGWMIAAPTQAAPAGASGVCSWDADTDTWQVSWTVVPTPPAGVDSYRLAGVTADPAGPIEGIAVTDPAAGYPLDASAPLTGTQRVAEGTATAALSVAVEWEDGQTGTLTGELDVAVDCEPLAPATQLGDWSVDCQVLTITVDNATADSLALTFAPSPGAPVDVEVAEGESATLRFPAADGLSVDVLAGGRSIVDPAEPITITAEQWRELDCGDGDNGEGGGLPATGAPIGLIIGGALALLALGGGLFLIARRRRIIFTAQ